MNHGGGTGVRRTQPLACVAAYAARVGSAH